MRNFITRAPSLIVKEEISDNELAELIRLAKANDADALERLCTHAYARLYPYIYYRVSHTENAEDLTSEVILKMVKSLKGQKGSFRAWMYTIARNAVIEAAKTVRKIRRAEVTKLDIKVENDKPTVYRAEVNISFEIER